MKDTYATGLVWFRRDLRAHDHAALHHALRACGRVHCAFVFDRAILDALPRRDRRVEFIAGSVAALDEELRTLAHHPDAGLVTRHGVAAGELPRLARELGVQAVFANHDDEPLALERDAQVRTALARDGIAFHTAKDTNLFERREILTQAGTPYTVFTPYSRAWLARLDDAQVAPFPVQPRAAGLAPRPEGFREPPPTLASLGFEPTNLRSLGIEGGSRAARRALDRFMGRIDAYARDRDFPAIDGTSCLGVHLRFGTLSIRECAGAARSLSREGSEGAATWLKELCWRDFFFQVLANFPHVAGAGHYGANFRREFDAVRWEEGAQADAHFAAWREGRTGFPIVDAAMRQIAATGFMHNRLRMVAASFLTKDLGIDWRRGAAYFAETLNDFELASNNGNWQWAASTGCDAQPWFRIFNPQSQARKFDPDGRFVAHYLGSPLPKDYPAPIVDHDEARERTLRRFAAVGRREPG